MALAQVTVARCLDSRNPGRCQAIHGAAVSSRSHRARSTRPRATAWDTAWGETPRTGARGPAGCPPTATQREAMPARARATAPGPPRQGGPPQTALAAAPGRAGRPPEGGSADRGGRRPRRLPLRRKRRPAADPRIPAIRRARAGAALPKAGPRVSPGPGARSPERAVAGPGAAGERPERGHAVRAARVEVQVADAVPEGGRRRHHEGRVAALEEVPDPLLAAVDGPGGAGPEGPHAPGQGARPGPDQAVGVVREGPGVDGEGPLLRQGGEADEEVRPIGVGAEEPGALDPAHPHLVQRVRRLQPRLAWPDGVAARTPWFTWQRPGLYMHFKDADAYPWRLHLNPYERDIGNN